MEVLKNVIYNLTCLSLLRKSSTKTSVVNCSSLLLGLTCESCASSSYWRLLEIHEDRITRNNSNLNFSWEKADFLITRRYIAAISSLPENLSA